MTLIPLIQTIVFRIVLMMAFASPTLLIAWAFCRFAPISASSKVLIVRISIVKSLVFDALMVGCFGLFGSAFVGLETRIWAVPDAINAFAVNAYVVGVGVLCIVLIASVILGERIRKRAGLASRTIGDLVEGLSSQLDQTKPIPVRISDEVECASVVGLIRPTILLPLEVNKVGATEILHEIAHIQHRDLIWTLATKICQAIFFVLPWAHWFKTEAYLWQEISADHVATFQCTARRYELAEAIIRMTSRVNAPVLSMSGTGKHVARRLDFLYRPVRGSWTSLGAYAVLLASMAPVPMMEARARTLQKESPGRVRTVAKIQPVAPMAVASKGGQIYTSMATKL